jgi:8-oxo-dGTP pyrophosphatase MutT (NUDIX family)
MNTNFQNFINSLSTRLEGPLPGHKAHELLMPVSRKKYPANPDISKAKKSSVLALFYPEKDSVNLIFIQRPLYNGVHSGQIAFPGGAFELEDKNFKTTALRETYEEIGVPPEEIIIIGKLSDLYIPPSNFLVYPYVGYLRHQPVFNPDPKEVHEVFALDVYHLLDKSCLQEREVSGSGYRFNVPCFYLDGRLIWGATSMMLSELIAIVGEIK